MNLENTFILIFSLYLLIGCNTQKINNISETRISKDVKIKNIQKIELGERTRGTNRLITFSENTMVVNLNGHSNTVPFTSQEWENISHEATLIDLEKISTYESPTTERYSDGALASTIIITANGKTYSSTGFDSGKPPTELKALYNKLKNLHVF